MLKPVNNISNIWQGTRLADHKVEAVSTAVHVCCKGGQLTDSVLDTNTTGGHVASTIISLPSYVRHWDGICSEETNDLVSYLLTCDSVQWQKCQKLLPDVFCGCQQISHRKLGAQHCEMLPHQPGWCRALLLSLPPQCVSK